MNAPKVTPVEQLPVTSSVPEPLPEEQEALFRETLQTLSRHKVPFAVAGGFALQQHTGICRYTKDLDIFLRPADASAMLAHLEEAGFECEVRDPVWLAKAYRDDFFVDLITGMSNGTITVDETWIARAHHASIFGVETRILAPEELLASKLFILRRERYDGADIAHIVHSVGLKLDWQRILDLTGDHWEVLLMALVLFRFVYPMESGLVPLEIWDELLSRFSREVHSPDPCSKFRGSLVDDRMFAIDIAEWGMENLLEEYQEKRERISALPETPRR